MTFLAVTLFVILWVGSLIATFVPVLPSSFILWGAALLYAFMTGFAEINVLWLVGLGIVAACSSLLDNVAGAWGTRRYGGSKYAAYGALIGGIVGIFLGPIGILAGPLLGAFIAEIFFGERAARHTQEVVGRPEVSAPTVLSNEERKRLERAISSTKGTFVGMLLGIGAKLAIHFFMGLAVLVRVAF